MKEFAKLYSAVASVESQFGLNSLEKEERLIFVFIVSQVANENDVRIPEIVDSNITSRASTYRHINSLRDLALIDIGKGGRRDVVTLSSRFKTFNKTLLKALAKFK